MTLHSSDILFSPLRVCRVLLSDFYFPPVVSVRSLSVRSVRSLLRVIDDGLLNPSLRLTAKSLRSWVV